MFVQQRPVNPYLCAAVVAIAALGITLLVLGSLGHHSIIEIPSSGSISMMVLGGALLTVLLGEVIRRNRCEKKQQRHHL